MYADNDAEEPEGFVYDIYEDTAEFVLFEPTDLSDIDCIEIIPLREEWPEMLVDALNRSTPEIRQMWIEIMEEDI